MLTYSVQAFLMDYLKEDTELQLHVTHVILAAVATECKLTCSGMA
jgi:hypothetical protein